MTESELKHAEARRYRAMIDSNLEALAELLDDDLVYTHSNAAIDTKKSYLKKVGDGTFRYGSIDIEEEEITLFSDLAILRGRMKAKGFLAGNPLVLDNRFLAVSKFKNGEWRLLAYQPTPVKNPE
jgi:hypothetical protein